MPYAIVQEMIDRFGEKEILQLTNREDPRNGAIDEFVVENAIADAGNRIDSYLGQRYSLPLATIPGGIKDACIHMARYNLYDDKKPEWVKDRYNEAVAWLKDIATGKASLGEIEEPAAAPSSGKVVVQQGNSKFDWDAY